MAQRTPENNTAFLLSLPTTLRREVLADMEESQFDMLPPELAAEARQLRREHEERIARTVQNGVLTHSFTTRTDRKLPCSSCYVHLICCICTFFSSNLSRNVLIFSRLLLCHNPSQLWSQLSNLISLFYYTRCALTTPGRHWMCSHHNDPINYGISKWKFDMKSNQLLLKPKLKFPKTRIEIA